MIIIRRLLVLLLITVCCALVANADSDKSFKCENNTYSSTGRVNANSSAPISTGFQWTNSKGNTYPIYISDSGSCYIIKKSNKTGKDYKLYMKPVVSQDICAKLDKEYKSKKKMSYNIDPNRPTPFYEMSNIYRYTASNRNSISFLYVF